jgi:hypothetical protein
MVRLLVLHPLSLLVAACGGTSSPSSSGGSAQQTIRISEKEYSLTPSTVRIAKTGTYELEATNNGTIAHALELDGHEVEAKTGDPSPATPPRCGSPSPRTAPTAVLPDRRPQSPGHERHGHRGKRLRWNNDQRRRDYDQRIATRALQNVLRADSASQASPA